MTPDDILHDLGKYDFPRAYHTRRAAFGTSETDQAAVLAASAPASSHVTKDEVQKFLHRLWSMTSTALDRGEHHPDHKPALAQLELELANLVMTLRCQTIKRF